MQNDELTKEELRELSELKDLIYPDTNLYHCWICKGYYLKEYMGDVGCRECEEGEDV